MLAVSTPPVSTENIAGGASSSSAPPSPNLSPSLEGNSPHSLLLPPTKMGLLSELGKALLSNIPLSDSKNPGTEEVWMDCFAGRDAVEWLSSNCNVTPESAVLIAQSLLDGRVFFPKLPADPLFIDGPDSIYSINEPDKSPAAPVGVITPLTPCYSSSCRVGAKCYSPTCPRASWRVRHPP